MDFGIKKFIIDCISAFHPIKIDVKVGDFNSPISIGGKTFQVVKGQIVINEEGERIPLEQDHRGYIRPIIKGVAIEGLADSKSKNVRLLDSEEKIFTRADIGSDQLELLTSIEIHERIIKKLKPLLQGHNNGVDLGALLASSAIIKVEDEGEDKELSKRLHSGLITAYAGRGSMIYNLFRSEILRIEVLNYINQLQSGYGDIHEVRMHFLMYWDSIIVNGYPNAIFIGHEETRESFFKEVKRRFNNGIKTIYIYSRGDQRNTYTEIWCREYAKENTYKCKRLKKYELGFTPAIKVRIVNPI